MQADNHSVLADLMMAAPLSDSEDEWEALRQESYTPLLANGAGGTTRSVTVRRMPTDVRDEPQGWHEVVSPNFLCSRSVYISLAKAMHVHAI